MTIYACDETLLQHLFNNDKFAKVIISFFQMKKVKLNVPSNIYDKLMNNPKIKDQPVSFMLKTVLHSFGNGSYENFNFDESIINMVNVLLRTDETVLITAKNYSGSDLEGGESLNKDIITLLNLKAMYNFIKYSDKKFLEWYEANAAYKIQKATSENSLPNKDSEHLDNQVEN